MSTFTFNSAAAVAQPRPLHERQQPIAYVAPDGTHGQTAYPINYDELYNLKGRLLTLVDATYVDPVQRKAHKDLVWQALRSWMDDIASRSDFATNIVTDNHYGENKVAEAEAGDSDG